MYVDADINSQSSKSIRSETIKKHHEFYINDNSKNDSKFTHKDNSIKTTKYNLITFFPKALLFQFMRLANCYFLIIAIIQCIPEISPLSPTTAIAPIAFVLCVSILREGIEDYVRSQYDKLMNNEKVFVFKSYQFEEAISGELKIGEIILVKENDRLPADLILLDSSISEGIAYIETGTLDGEKTLKYKIANKLTTGFFYIENTFNNLDISGFCVSDPPNSELYKIEGNLDINIFDINSQMNMKKIIPIDTKQMLLKGAILKNTKWIIGFVIYTGKNTKLILNSKKPRMKFSRIENLMSKMLVFILSLQMILCFICAILNNNYYYAVVISNPFIPPPLRNSPAFDSFINYFTYMLLLNTMIPISLIISLEIVKLMQGYFTNVDVELYSHERNRYAKAGSISLNEELGNVNYIFSDKTGTLTCNKMQFKFCVIGDVCYEYNKKINSRDGNNLILKLNENRMREQNDIKQFGVYSMYQTVEMETKNKSKNGKSKIQNTILRSKYPNFILKDNNDTTCTLNLEEEHLLINEYWKAIAIAHECICDETEEGLSYIGISPDDIELVKTAAEQGYQFLKPTSTDVTRIKIGQEEKEFKVLHTIEFTSERKRMSIIIRDEDKIKIYIKGADSEISSRLSKNSREEFQEAATNYVDLFSAKGYRTLLVGMKIIDEKSYEEWSKKLSFAALDLDNKKDEIDKCYEELEQNFYLLGATVVEDRLQDKVAETIRDLRLAGIKIWMLTGDKMNTAFNIGLSCNLISKSLKIFCISGEKGENIEKLIREFNKFCFDFNNQNNGNSDEVKEDDKDSHTTSHPFSIIIDSVALTIMLKSKSKTKIFVEIASQSCSVICCRVSPLQKAEVVKIMKNYNDKCITLSIGDGGNDVSMIMEAHIGIGVYGEEGLRAVQASDFAIGEFKLLRRLLLFHGRNNNMRISEMILYFFFKNFVFTIIHFYYGLYNNFSGQTIIDDWLISLYNMIFTAIPLGIRALSDFDIKPEDGSVVNKMLPFIYKEARDNPIFTKYNFILSLTRGVVFGLITFFYIIISLDKASVDSTGNTADIWFISANLFTSIIFMVSFRLLNVQKHFTWITPFIMFTSSWFVYFGFLIIVQFGAEYKSQGTMGVIINSSLFYFNLFFTVIVTTIIDKAIYAYKIIFDESIVGSIMISRQEKKDLNNINEMPKVIRNAYKKYKHYDLSDSDDIKLENTPKQQPKEYFISHYNNNNNFKESSGESKSYAKSLKDPSNKFSQELLLMDAPYKKKITEVLEKRINELIIRKEKSDKSSFKKYSYHDGLSKK